MLHLSYLPVCADYFSCPADLQPPVREVVYACLANFVQCRNQQTTAIKVDNSHSTHGILEQLRLKHILGDFRFSLLKNIFSNLKYKK